MIANHLGWYKESVALLEEFLKYYPGREVYHNIGTAYLKSALDKFRQVNGNRKLPFQLSIETEPVTRAGAIEIGRNETKYSPEFRMHLDKAIEYLVKAAESDPIYGPARVNLAAAYILDERYYSALSELEQALSLDPNNSAATNNSAIAYFLLGDSMDSDQFRERGYGLFEKAMLGGCGVQFRSNHTLAGLKLGKDIGGSFMEPAATELQSMPSNVQFSNKPGAVLKQNAVRLVGEIGLPGNAKLSLHHKKISDEFVLASNGVVKMVYKKTGSGSENASGKCTEGFISVGRKGFDSESGIYFSF